MDTCYKYADKMGHFLTDSVKSGSFDGINKVVYYTLNIFSLIKLLLSLSLELSLHSNYYMKMKYLFVRQF